jgi:L-ribulose-5-phosphate 4-epimerase
MSNYQHIKEECYHANMQLPQLGLVLFTFGNVSVASRELNVFAIKPSGMPLQRFIARKNGNCRF